MVDVETVEGSHPLRGAYRDVADGEDGDRLRHVPVVGGLRREAFFFDKLHVVDKRHVGALCEVADGCGLLFQVTQVRFVERVGVGVAADSLHIAGVEHYLALLFFIMIL